MELRMDLFARIRRDARIDGLSSRGLAEAQPLLFFFFSRHGPSFSKTAGA